MKQPKFCVIVWHGSIRSELADYNVNKRSWSLSTAIKYAEEHSQKFGNKCYVIGENQSWDVEPIYSTGE